MSLRLNLLQYLSQPAIVGTILALFSCLLRGTFFRTIFTELFVLIFIDPFTVMMVDRIYRGRTNVVISSNFILTTKSEYSLLYLLVRTNQMQLLLMLNKRNHTMNKMCLTQNHFNWNRHISSFTLVATNVNVILKLTFCKMIHQMLLRSLLIRSLTDNWATHTNRSEHVIRKGIERRKETEK